jgi:hypothetical protein
MMTPLERRSAEDYFLENSNEEDYVPGPDFVNLDEELEAADQDTIQDDEAHVRRLVKRGNAGAASWFGDVLGWTLFSVEENEEESDGDGGDTEGEGGAAVLETRRSSISIPQFEGVSTGHEERMPPPKADEGGWQDAAWLLSVASKVLL